MTTIDISNWSVLMLSALERMHQLSVSNAKFALTERYNITKYIREHDHYTIYQAPNEIGRYLVETDLTEEEFMKKVLKYL